MSLPAWLPLIGPTCCLGSHLCAGIQGGEEAALCQADHAAVQDPAHLPCRPSSAVTGELLTASVCYLQLAPTLARCDILPEAGYAGGRVGAVGGQGGGGGQGGVARVPLQAEEGEARRGGVKAGGRHVQPGEVVVVKGDGGEGGKPAKPAQSRLRLAKGGMVISTKTCHMPQLLFPKSFYLLLLLHRFKCLIEMTSNQKIFYSF